MRVWILYDSAKIIFNTKTPIIQNFCLLSYIYLITNETISFSRAGIQKKKWCRNCFEIRVMKAALLLSVQCYPHLRATLVTRIEAFFSYFSNSLATVFVSKFYTTPNSIDEFFKSSNKKQQFQVRHFCCWFKSLLLLTLFSDTWFILYL